MRKGKYYRECTCTRCEGTGLQKEYWGKEEFFFSQEGADDSVCLECDGKGYVIDDVIVEDGEILHIFNL
jgi:DnaJ-class molecular chaperone